MSTKRLMIALGVLSMVGCDDSAMNLGPGVSVASGGKPTTAAGASSGGASVTVPLVAGASGSTQLSTAGGVGAGGDATGGVGTAGGASGYGGQAGTPTINGLNLTGLKRFSLESSAGFVRIDPLAPCKGDEPVTYSVDLATKTYEYAHCAVGTDGGATVAREPRILSDEELTAGMMMLEQISLNHRNTCGADKGIETLVLSFDDREESYQDDFYAGCQGGGQPPPTYVANMEWLHTFLSMARSGATIPAAYDRLEIIRATTTDQEVQWVNECQTSYLSKLTVDFAARQVSESRCEQLVTDGSAGPAQLKTSTLALNDADLANLRQEISALKYGATRECSEGNVRLSFAWLYSNDSAVASLVDSRAACPGQSSKYLRFTLGLNNLYASIEARFRPLL